MKWMMKGGREKQRKEGREKGVEARGRRREGSKIGKG